ncbi:hypothetical protein CRG98_023787 [Punica granatum]|uniref:Uncharacterized protein n=1 Tax=Punica granatum TaxID=22663 RepID=A0A2I0JHV2_PUNGR|nr:hypothetical protein CRG98_023787 [Punica granatum]
MGWIGLLGSGPGCWAKLGLCWTDRTAASGPRRREVVWGGRAARVAMRGEMETGRGAEGAEVRESGRVS